MVVRNGMSLGAALRGPYSTQWYFRTVASLVQLILRDDAAAETAAPALRMSASYLCHETVNCAVVVAATGGATAAEAVQLLSDWRDSPLLQRRGCATTERLLHYVEYWVDTIGGEDGRRERVLEVLRHTYHVGDAGAAGAVVSAESLRLQHRAQNAADLRRCALCARVDVRLRRCKRCQSVWYCSDSCQKEHWPAHRQTCVDSNATLAIGAPTATSPSASNE